MAGVCRSIIENVFTKVIRSENNLGDKIVVQGGTFKNDAVLRSLEQYLDKEVIRAPYPGEMGALGAAILTKRDIAVNGYTHGGGKTRFIGLDAMADFDYKQETNFKCNFCTNNCNRTLIRFSNGTTWVTGNRCEKGEIIGDIKDPAVRETIKKIDAEIDAVPDMIKIRDKLLFKDYPFTNVSPKKNITIGLPRVLDFWRTMPFFVTFFKSLGFDVKISRKSSKKIFEQGLPFVASDTVCFPAKLVHGHTQDLAMEKVDRIFLPIFCRLPSDNSDPASTYTCPVLKGYPIVVRFSDNPERRWNIPFDTPVFHWFRNKDRDFQLTRYMKETFNVPNSVTKKAIVEADKALSSFNKELLKESARITKEVEKSGKFAVVISGRHYQFDELVNHNLSRYFTSLGIPVLTVDSLPGLASVDLSKTMLDITNNNHAQLLTGAIVAAENPVLEYVEIFSFGCGHDALYTDEVVRIMKNISNKIPLILKLDESDVAGPLRIRVRSFIETVKARRLGVPSKIKSLTDPYPVKYIKADRKEKVILVPNVSRAFCKIISASIRQDGARAEALPTGGKLSIQLGKKYVHNDICFPAQIVIGEALEALKSGKYDTNNVVIGTGKSPCDCRLTNYMVLTRIALDKAGFAHVPILSTDFIDSKNMHPGFRFTPITYLRSFWCITMADILEDLRHKIRPYELEKGETDRVFEESIDIICEGLETKGLRGALNAFKKAIDEMCKIRYDRTKKKSVVFITGEYLLTYHPGSNFYVEKYLEENNMEVKLPYMHDFYRNVMVFHVVSEIKDFKVQHSLYETLYGILGDKYCNFAIDVMEKVAKKHPLFEESLRMPEMAKLSDDIIHHSIQSGESFVIAADLLHNASNGIKAFIILQPFGCLPNHFCGRGIVKRIKEIYPDIQILPLDYDPDISFANIENRLQMLIMNVQNIQNTSL
jgi:predicted nucleotide-binding protein (sugar kinase/HSP70/actin superfamily)